MYVHAMTCASENSHLSYEKGKKCFSKCALEKVGIFDESNSLNVEHLVKITMNSAASKSFARSMAEKCAVKREESENNCEWAFRVYECLHARELMPKVRL